MKFSSLYFQLVLKKPVIVLLLFTIVFLTAIFYSGNFKLDASGDSLVLENDASLNYYREISQKYSSDDFVIITYKPNTELLSEHSLQTIRRLREDLLKLESITSVVSILDVPIIYQSGLELSQLEDSLQSIDSGFSDFQVAEQEFLTNPLYRNLLVNKEASITAIQAIFKRDEQYEQMLSRRAQLQSSAGKLSKAAIAELDQLKKEIEIKNYEYAKQRDKDIKLIRQIIDKQRDRGTLYLGGIPMITVDMIQFIRHDLVVFGSGVFIFLILILSLFFHKVYWVLLPLLTCLITGTLTVGFLGFADWPVTVISSNFLSILLIITLSLTIHLIVRYRDLQLEHSQAEHFELIELTISSMARPCFYTILTTIVAFASLVVSEIRPVINFGWIMVIGLAIAFIVGFTIMPATLSLIKRIGPSAHRDITRNITLGIAGLVQRFPHGIIVISCLFILGFGFGITKLEVENRFINNFKSDTEIYRGMKLIDDELGGTMPLDIILDPDTEYVLEINNNNSEVGELEELLLEKTDPQPGYWLNSIMMAKAKQIHEKLETYPVIGKVMSIVTSVKIFEKLNKAPFDAFELGLLRNRVPESVRQNLFNPYLSEDSNEIRFSMRVIESDPELNRKELLESIHSYLVEDLQLQENQVHLTGMMELYNNMLQSLYRSQILSIGAVSLAIMFMFIVLFRNLQLALIAVIPNAFSTVMIMGVMGWTGIPLDMMTITIASITLGISVDNTIHYLHRLQKEYPLDMNFSAAINRCHGGVGKAMYYTSMAIIFGFAILSFSDFIPTIYFGLLVGCALFFALIGDLVLLPAVVLLTKPKIIKSAG